MDIGPNGCHGLHVRHVDKGHDSCHGRDGRDSRCGCDGRNGHDLFLSKSANLWTFSSLLTIKAELIIRTYLKVL